MDDVLILFESVYVKDDYGVDRETLNRKTVYVKVTSVTRNEFYQAGRNGLNPEFKFIMFRGDYDGQTLCEFHGRTYAIYRTYCIPNSDTIELYVERKGGTNGKEAKSTGFSPQHGQSNQGSIS